MMSGDFEQDSSGHLICTHITSHLINQLLYLISCSNSQIISILIVDVVQVRLYVYLGIVGDHLGVTSILTLTPWVHGWSSRVYGEYVHRSNETGFVVFLSEETRFFCEFLSNFSKNLVGYETARLLPFSYWKTAA